MPNTITTKEQQRAKFALDKISELHGKIDSETANFFVGLPTMLLTNGLGQTLAFLLSKKGKSSDKYVIAFNAIKEWLKLENNNTNFEILQSFNKMSQKDYLEKQKEALAVANWLKRYARAFEVNKDDKDDSNSK